MAETRREPEREDDPSAIAVLRDVPGMMLYGRIDRGDGFEDETGALCKTDDVVRAYDASDRTRAELSERLLAALTAVPAAAPVTSGEPQLCEWLRDEDGVYGTGCGNAFFFDTGTLAENRAKHCIYCGGAIVDASKSGRQS